MGFDSRIAAALLSLGYRIFPFEAFDQNGKLLVPDSVDFPEDVETGLGTIVSNPLWADLYRTMSPLRSHHRVFMAGIGFINDRVQVALFKSTTTVSGPQEAMNWADSYHNTVEQTLHRYAGTSYLLNPAWRTIVDKAKGALPPAQRDAQADDVSNSVQDGQAPDGPPSDEPLHVAAIPPWLLFGLDLIFELVTKATVRTKVLTTVAWYPDKPVDNAWAAAWKPIHTDLQRGWLSGHRSTHLIWNPVGLPVTISGQGVAWQGPGLDMPHLPVQWCQALRPLANCLGRPTATANGVDVTDEVVDADEPITRSVHAG